MSAAPDSPVARTILQQLGGSRFVAMTGARNIVFADDYLGLSLPRGMARNKATKMVVRLADHDTYTVEFGKFTRSYNYVEISQHEGVYVDSLRRLFTEQTGLDTSL